MKWYKIQSQDKPVRVEQNGRVFENGKPVTFPYVRKMEKAPDMGERFQQHIEPHGRYMVHNTSDTKESESWETGEMSFKNPLVIPLNLSGSGTIYDENSWKMQLVRMYRGLTGLELSKAIINDGYDGIVTVTLGPDDVAYDTREIVDLNPIIEKLKSK